MLGYIPVAGPVLKIATKPIRWAARNPVKALAGAALASGLLGIGTGFVQKPEGLIDLQGAAAGALATLPRGVSNYITGLRGGISAMSSAYDSASAAADAVGSARRSAEMFYNVTKDVSPGGSPLMIPGHLVRGTWRAVGGLGNIALRAPYHAGVSAGHLLKSADQVILKPVKAMISPVVNAAGRAYTRVSYPGGFVNRLLTKTGYVDVPDADVTAAAAARLAATTTPSGVAWQVFGDKVPKISTPFDIGKNPHIVTEEDVKKIPQHAYDFAIKSPAAAKISRATYRRAVDSGQSYRDARAAANAAAKLYAEERKFEVEEQVADAISPMALVRKYFGW